MGIVRGANIVQDGLVFGYDTGYGVADNETGTRFYPGAPAVNLNTDPYHSTKSAGDTISLAAWGGDTGQGSFEVNTSPDGGGMMFINNNTSNPAGTGGVYTDFPTTRYTLTNGVTYTRSWWCKSNINQTLSGHICSCNRDSDNLYIVGGNISLTTEWQRFSETFTYTGSTSTDWQFRHINYNTSIVYIANVQLEVNGFASPFVNGTRSDTASLIDLKRTVNIDVSDVSFDSTGQPTFDGTDDVINLPNDLGYGTTSVSVFAWYKIDGTPGNGYHIICGDTALEMSIHSSATYLRNGVSTTNGRHVSNNGNQTLNDGNYHYYGFTFDGSTKTAYIDGVQVGTQSVTGTLTNIFSGRKVGAFSGGYYANGDLPVYKVYNKVFTDAEVKQNYNAYKNRFNT